MSPEEWIKKAQDVLAGLSADHYPADELERDATVLLQAIRREKEKAWTADPFEFSDFITQLEELEDAARVLFIRSPLDELRVMKESGRIGNGPTPPAGDFLGQNWISAARRVFDDLKKRYIGDPHQAKDEIHDSAREFLKEIRRRRQICQSLLARFGDAGMPAGVDRYLQEINILEEAIGTLLGPGHLRLVSEAKFDPLDNSAPWNSAIAPDTRT